MFRNILIISIIVSFFPLNLVANNDQKEFCKINKKYSDLSKKTSKDLKLQLYKRKRKKELSNLNFEFKNWKGKIEEIDSVGDEYAYVSISVCKNVTIKTWNNEFSDMMNKTLIHIDSEIYEMTATLDGNKTFVTLLRRFLRNVGV